MVSDDERYWPPRFEQWPHEDQIAYVGLRFKRPDLIALIGELADIHSINDREIDPDNARLTKDELADLALALGVYRRYLDREQTEDSTRRF